MRNVLRRPDFRLLFAGLVASMVGESILLLALAIWVKDITDSNGLAGTTIFAVVAPMALAPVVGWFVDRYRRRPFLVVANLTTAVILTPLFLVRGEQHLWLIYTVAAFYGLSYIAISAALNGLIKEVVPEEQLAEANGALQTVKQGLRLVGPIAGAGMYAAAGGWTVAAAGIAGFVLAAGAIAALRVVEAKPKPSEVSFVAEAMAGLRYLVGHAALRRSTVGIALAILLIGLAESLFFAYVDDGLHKDPAFLGVLVSVQGIGGLTGGLIAARVVRRMGELGATALGVLLLGVTNLAFVVPNLWLAFPATVLFGAGIPIAVVGATTLMQRVTPSELMGRVSAATDTLITGPQALSIAAGAILVSIVDYRLLFGLMAIGVSVAAWYLWLGRRLTPAGTPSPVAEPVTAPTGAA